MTNLYFSPGGHNWTRPHSSQVLIDLTYFNAVHTAKGTDDGGGFISTKAGNLGLDVTVLSTLCSRRLLTLSQLHQAPDWNKCSERIHTSYTKPSTMARCHHGHLSLSISSCVVSIPVYANSTTVALLPYTGNSNATAAGFLFGFPEIAKPTI